MKLLGLCVAACLSLTACKSIKTGVTKKAVEDKIQSAFAAKGLELTEVVCPAGPLSGEVECIGKSAEGLEAAIVVTIQKEDFLRHDLDFKTRGVAVGFVVADIVATSSKEKYGVALEVTCPPFRKETEVMECKGQFDGAEITVEYQNGGWKTAGGVIDASKVADLLAKIAEERGLGVDRAAIDCGTGILGMAPGREIACTAGDRKVTLAVDDDASGVHVVRDEAATP